MYACVDGKTSVRQIGRQTGLGEFETTTEGTVGRRDRQLLRSAADRWRKVLGPGDWIEIPRGTVHNASVMGDEPVVSLDAVKL